MRQPPKSRQDGKANKHGLRLILSRPKNSVRRKRRPRPKSKPLGRAIKLENRLNKRNMRRREESRMKLPRKYKRRGREIRLGRILQVAKVKDNDWYDNLIKAVKCFSCDKFIQKCITYLGLTSISEI